MHNWIRFDEFYKIMKSFFNFSKTFSNYWPKEKYIHWDSEVFI